MVKDEKSAVYFLNQTHTKEDEMKRRKLFSKLMGVSLVLTLTIMAAFLIATAGQADAKTIKLKAVSFLPKSVTGVRFTGVFAKKVTERSKGELVIQWIGGPDVMPPPSMGKAVMKGMIDLLTIASGRIKDIMPEACANHLSEFTPMEERKTGYYEWLRKHYQKRMNVYYLGRMQSNVGWVTGTSFPIGKPGDLAGRQIGARSPSVKALKALGAAPTVLKSTELFTAVERGLVDGYTLPFTNIIPWGLLPVTKYIVDHEFYKATQTQLVINLNKWNKLPEKHRNLMKEVAMELEPEIVAFFGKKARQDRQKFTDAGVKFVTFAPEDAKTYSAAMTNAAWEDFKKIVSPEEYAKARELLLK